MDMTQPKSDRLPYEHATYEPAEMRARGEGFLDSIRRRRSVREFDTRPVSRDCIALAIQAAGTAPSGAHQQPWTFVAVADQAVKREIRMAAEEEERQFYQGPRITDAWRQALAPLETDWQKPFLESAPWLVVVFAQNLRITDDGSQVPNYYVKESVGIACGFFILALHAMGLATLTHTPSPMGFLSSILKRPVCEKPYILFPVGYPAPGATVPNLRRKSIDELAVWFLDSNKT